MRQLVSLWEGFTCLDGLLPYSEWGWRPLGKLGARTANSCCHGVKCFLRLPRCPSPRHRSGDCKEEVRPKVAASKGAVSVYCLEPSQTNFASLIKTRDLFFKDNSPSVQW